VKLNLAKITKIWGKSATIIKGFLL